MGQINILNDAGTAKLSLQFTGTTNKSLNSELLSSITSDVQTQLDSKVSKSGSAMSGRLTTELNTGGNAAKIVQTYNGTDTTGALQAISAGAGGSGLDAAHWTASDSNWATRWYGNAQRSASGNVSDAGSIFLGGITAGGKLLTPLQPAFFARSNYASNGGPSGVYIFSDILTNISNCYSSSNGRFTAPITGTYYIYACALSRNAGSLNAYLRKNGSAVVFSEDSRSGSFGDVHPRVILTLTAGDYVDFYCNNATYGGLYDYFGGYLIG